MTPLETRRLAIAERIVEWARKFPVRPEPIDGPLMTVCLQLSDEITESRILDDLLLDPPTEPRRGSVLSEGARAILLFTAVQAENIAETEEEAGWADELRQLARRK